MKNPHDDPAKAEAWLEGFQAGMEWLNACVDRPMDRFRIARLKDGTQALSILTKADSDDYQVDQFYATPGGLQSIMITLDGSKEVNPVEQFNTYETLENYEEVYERATRFYRGLN